MAIARKPGAMSTRSSIGGDADSTNLRFPRRVRPHEPLDAERRGFRPPLDPRRSELNALATTLDLYVESLRGRLLRNRNHTQEPLFAGLAVRHPQRNRRVGIDDDEHHAFYLRDHIDPRWFGL